MRLHQFLLTVTIFATLGAVVSGCAPSRFVEPLPSGHTYITAGLGGPLIDYAGTVIPMPLSSVAAGYGISSKVTGFGGLHTTALMFEGVQLDLGSVIALSDPEGWTPGVSVSPIANLALSLRDGAFNAWPELAAYLYWRYAPSGNLIYLGTSSWFELKQTRGTGEPIPWHRVTNLLVGHRFEGDAWQYIIEAKYLALGLDNKPNVVEYHGISGKGSIGLYLGLTRKF